MKISHVAIWTEHLEELCVFFSTYFGGRCGEKYINKSKKFESYVLSFDGECRLELMRKSDLHGPTPEERVGLAHLAFACRNKEAVNELTEQLRKDGYKIVEEPRTTGDGYFESVVADPDGNRVEITC